MEFPAEIHTDRLVLERPTVAPAIVEEVHDACSSESMREVTRYMPWNPHESFEETESILHGMATEFDDGVSANYLLRDETGELLGMGCLSPRSEQPSAQLGCWLRKSHWGNGYSGERARALVQLAFEELDLQLVCVKTLDGNRRSFSAIRGYVKPLGGSHTGYERVAAGDKWDGWESDDILTHHVFSITRREYELADPPEAIESLRW